jgi:salicylate hydroxylase
VTVSRPVILVAGAGIGGLTAALALAAKGFQVTVIEKVELLEEAGAGLQLSPNASRILVDLGLKLPLAACATTPDAVSIMSGRRGTELARLPLDEADADAPYWVLHRADLQAALVAKVEAHPDIELRLGCQFDSFTTMATGVLVNLQHGATSQRQAADALIGADGLWSGVRQQLYPTVQPLFSGSIAWRGTIDASRLPIEPVPRRVQLWMGSNAHLVTYPISGGRQTNVVAISSGTWQESGWSAAADAAEVGAAFGTSQWSAEARAIIAAVTHWRKWALFTLPHSIPLVADRTALLGDAAHAMLPFAAQGAGMAIEDAAVLAACLADRPEYIATALQRYASLRQPRVSRVQSFAQSNGRIYHLAGPAAAARDIVMKLLGGRRLLARQNWIYDWRP